MTSNFTSYRTPSFKGLGILAVFLFSICFAAAAFAQTGSISGTIWEDQDGDGVRDVGEPGIEYVNLQLIVFDEFGTPSVLIYRTTDAAGDYSFPNLPGDDYVVYVEEYTVPTNYTQTYDPDGAADNETQIALAAAQVVTGVDFGYIGPGSISGLVWEDLDGDGLREAGEPGVEYVAVELIVFDEFGTPSVLIRRLTDASGAYSFDFIPPDDYVVYVDGYTLPEFFTPTNDPDGGAENEVSISLAPGQVVTGVEFGYIGPGSISGVIWDDLDADGVREAGEPGLEYVNLQLIVFDEIGAPQVLIYRTTDASGAYSFDSIPQDDYVVYVEDYTLPTNYVSTFDPDGAAPGNEAHYSLAPGQVIDDVDFGYFADPLWTGLIGYWPLDNYNGTTAIDVTVNAHDGAILGNPTWEAGVVDSALRFDGAGDALGFGGDPLHGAPPELTISVWMKHAPTTGWRSIVDTRDATADGYDLYLNPAGAAFFRLNNATLTGSAALDDDAWHHLAAVWDGNEMRLYVDGLLDASASTGAQTVSVTNPLRIGENYALGNSFFAGTLDEVRLYDRGLPEEDVVALFEFGGGVLPPPDDITAGLAAHWTLDDGAGATAVDATGSGFDGVVSGATWTTGPISGALDFDGANDNIVCPAGAPLDAPAAVSIAAWIRHPTASGWHSIVDKRDSGQDGYDLYINGASRLYARVDTGTLTGSIVADDTWRHVAMVYDGDVLSLYVDGALDASLAIGAMSIDTTAPIRIGENWALGNSFFAGMLDDVRIYDRALTSGEVFDLYDLGN